MTLDNTDSFPGSNVFACRHVSVEESRQLCVAKNFNGFVVFREMAYFRAQTGQDLLAAATPTAGATLHIAPVLTPVGSAGIGRSETATTRPMYAYGGDFGPTGTPSDHNFCIVSAPTCTLPPYYPPSPLLSPPHARICLDDPAHKRPQSLLRNRMALFSPTDCRILICSRSSIYKGPSLSIYSCADSAKTPHRKLLYKIGTTLRRSNHPAWSLKSKLLRMVLRNLLIHWP